MKINFSTFNQLQEGSSDYHVKHLEELDVESFIRCVEKLHKLDAVQKLDGANFRAGVDEKGKLFTSREQKGGKRFYKLADFPKRSSYDGFKTAHQVLNKVEDQILAVVSPGEAFSMEIIFGHQPNTVFYGKDNLNYIAILEMVPGDDPTIDPEQSKVKEIVRSVGAGVISVESTVSDTQDGVSITRAAKITDWKFTTSDKVPKDHIHEVSFDEEIEELKDYLENDNDVAREQGKIMSNFEVLKDRGQKLADERKTIEEKIMNDYKLPIKNRLLKLVQKQKPSLRGDSPEGEKTYNGIEGIIFTDPKTRERFKVVDREVFTRVNKFNYEVRKSIATRITSSNPDLPLEVRGGLVGEAHLRSVRLLGLPGTEVPGQAKRVIEKLKGDSREETVKNLVDSLHQLHFESVRRKIQGIYIATIDDLEEALDAFKKSVDTYSLKLDDEREVKYTPEIKRRTLLTFAEARLQLIDTLVKVKQTHYVEDLLEIFFKKQLDQLHGGDEDE